MSARLASIKASGKIRLGTAAALPWTGKDPATGKWFGPGFTLGEAIAKRLGVEPVWIEQTFAGMVPALQADQIDVGVAAMYATPARLAVIDMTEWSLGGTCYLALKTNTKVNSTADLNSPTITMANTPGTGTYQVIVDKYPLAKQLTKFQSSGGEASVLEVQSGRADVTPIDNPLGPTYATKYPDIKVIPSDCVTNPDVPTPISIGYQRGDAGFKQFLDTFLPTLRGQIDAEVQKLSDPKCLTDQTSSSCS